MGAGQKRAVRDRLAYLAASLHGSIAVAPLKPVQLLDLNHLGELLGDFEGYYNEHRCHQRLGSATPATVYRMQTWRKPDRSEKQLTGPIRMRHFREQRITVYELAA